MRLVSAGKTDKGPFFLIRLKTLRRLEKTDKSVLQLDRMVHIIPIEVKRDLEDSDMPRVSKTRQAVVARMMREDIFEAATTVLCKYGVNGTTMNRVAEAANLTKSNLYYYFRDKDELLQFFNTRLLEPCLQAIEEVAKCDLPASQKLEKILRTTWEFAQHHKGLVRLIMEADQDSTVRKTVRPRVLGLFTRVVEQGIREGSFRSHNAEHTGRVFNGALDGIDGVVGRRCIGREGERLR